MSLPLHLPDATPAELLREFSRARCGTAFAELVRRYAGLVTGTALRITGSREAAEDAAQEVFALLARKASSVNAASLGGWLHRVAVRRASAARRRSDARAQRDLAALMNTEQLSENTPDPQWAEILPALDRALDSLPAEDRAVVVLRYYEQLSFHEIAARLPLTAEAARKRSVRAIERLGRTLKSRGLSTSAAALAAGLAAQWKAEAAVDSTGLAAKALTRSAVLPAAAVLSTTLATMSTTRWMATGAVAVLVSAGAFAVPPLLRSFQESPVTKTPASIIARVTGAPTADTVPQSAPATPVAEELTEDALLAALKVDLTAAPFVKELSSFHPNSKPVRMEHFTLGDAPSAKDGRSMRLYLRWWPEENRYCFSYDPVIENNGYYGPFTGNPLTNHNLKPYLLARLEGKKPWFLSTNSAFSIVQDFVRSDDPALRRYGWEIFAALDKPALSTANNLTVYLRGNAAKQLKEDSASSDPALRALLVRVREKLDAAKNFYESCKEELPAESYQLVQAVDPAVLAGLPWGPEEDGLRFALILPEKVQMDSSFTLSWAVQNTGSKPVRLLFMGDGSPWLQWNGPDGKEISSSLNPNLNYSFHMEPVPRRFILHPGQCLRQSLNSAITIGKKGGAARTLAVAPGPLNLKASIFLPGTTSYDDDKKKVTFPARGEYEGSLDCTAAMVVE